VAIAAIKALANLALSDAAKEAIRESWGLPAGGRPCFSAQL